jgi:hypothetical protein
LIAFTILEFQTPRREICAAFALRQPVLILPLAPRRRTGAYKAR